MSSDIVADMDGQRELLRHLLATVAYRATRALEDAPESFADFDGAGRRPVEILAHMGDLLDWALSMAQGESRWKPAPPMAWAEEQRRFFASLGALDGYLASGNDVHAPIDRLMQAPVADALTHIGQLAMLRRLAGSPTRGENFYLANIAAGRVDERQPQPVRPFSKAK